MEAKRLCEEVLDAERAGRDSNEMSIDGEHQRSYHFDVVSPEFDALLAEEGVKDSPPRNLDGSVASSVTCLHQIHPSDSSSIKVKNNCVINLSFYTSRWCNF